VFSDRGGQFTRILRQPAVLGSEELPRDLGTSRARSLSGTGQSLGRPAAALSSAIRLATSTRNGGMSLL
jgi:hypothetical protein